MWSKRAISGQRKDQLRTCDKTVQLQMCYPHLSGCRPRGIGVLHFLPILIQCSARFCCRLLDYTPAISESIPYLVDRLPVPLQDTVSYPAQLAA